jgi:hypothetical protein
MGTFGTLDLGLGLTIRSRRNGAFDPVSALFGSGEQGYIIPWLPGTVWKDTARTIPCTAHDDLIAVADDISGNGNHYVQPISSLRFKWQTDGTRYWALPDAFDDFMSVALNMSGYSDVTVFAGVEKYSASTGILFELTANGNTTNGGFYIAAPNSTFDTSFAIRGASTATLASVSPSTTGKRVYTGMGSTANGAEQILRRNGVTVGTSTGTRGGGPLANSTIYLGSRAGSSLFFSGRIYPVIVRSGTTSPDLIAATEQWINAKTGAY